VTSAGELWGSGEYELLARRLAPTHAELVAALGPQPGLRWLDVGTGTGEVALRAARAGASVTALDLAPALIEQARAKAEAEALDVRWEVGDAQALPYADAEFDVVSSSFAVIFAPDHDAVARELARVCRRGGRLGLTTWEPSVLSDLYERFQDEPPPFDPEAWGREERVHELLGPYFAVTVERGIFHLEGTSPESLWDFMLRAAPPFKAFAERLAADRRRAFREAFLEHWEAHRVDGRVSEPRPYLLVVGTRR
jgi:SAM-dependent methyltransferase